MKSSLSYLLTAMSIVNTSYNSNPNMRHKKNPKSKNYSRRTFETKLSPNIKYKRPFIKSNMQPRTLRHG